MDSNCGSPSSDHTWFGFSLSNQNQYYHPHPHPHPHPPSNDDATTSHHDHHQHQQPSYNLSLFQHHPHAHVFSPHLHPAVDNGASSGGTHDARSSSLSFLGDGSLQVGLFPTKAEAVTVASTGNGGLYEQKESVSTGNLLGGLITTNNSGDEHQLERAERAALVEANNKQLGVIASVPSSSSRKIVDNFGQRTSIYRGVTRHRWTGRYEAHLWDNSCRREGQSRKGRQGGYDKEDKAARAYDLAALKYWGPTTTTNFPISDYEKELEEMKNMSRQEFVASLRRKSSGFSRGASMYRGVTRHHQHGRWQARIGRVAGNKDLYLGTFSTQEEAAEAYDIAAIKFRGLNAVTNFDISRYNVKSILSNNLPVGGLSNKSRSLPGPEEIKALESNNPHSLPLIPHPHHSSTSTPTNPNFIGIPLKPDSTQQNYVWPSLRQVDNTHEPLGYDFGYTQQAPTNRDREGATDGYNRYEGNSNNSDNNWIVAPNLHGLQSPKQNVAVLQTPIFGIE
ncbi:unnamed protein product [Amaranthus hypochondriacus]